MGQYPLEALLSVRHYRETAAAGNARRAESDLKQAEQAAADRADELTRFKTWHAEETERRYGSIMGVPCSIRELDEFKAGLASLDAQEVLKEEALAAAEKEADNKRKALEKARAAVKAAQKETAKIQAHKDIWTEDDKKETERKEDLELEEFRPLSRHGAEAEGEDA
ncbi:MAG: YscO family type III secretion system apparatus protein [Mailhella sp.]|nr:YscO family type III secretion system apparatus protein [Mailhella sp.]